MAGDSLKLELAVISIMLILAIGCTQQTPPVNPPANNTTACTMEAKICPDGSAVGRVGPNCEFAPCPQIVGNDSDAHGCKASAGYSWCETEQKCVREWETPCQLSVEEALTIARSSACKDAGNITSDGAAYNNNSNTWWLDIDKDMPGCNPACVVYQSRTAEINYRCTGVIVYTVKSANSTLGEILVDNGGYSLYSFTPDTGGVSTCYGACAENWPPLVVVDTISIPDDLDGTFGASARTDNSTQVTYNGMPLYTYAGDNAPGDTNGDGLNGKWYVVTVSG